MLALLDPERRLALGDAGDRGQEWDLRARRPRRKDVGELATEVRLRRIVERDLPPDLLDTSLAVLPVALFEASPCTFPDLLDTSLAVLPVALFEASPCTFPADLLATSLGVLPVALFEASPCTSFDATP